MNPDDYLVPDGAPIRGALARFARAVARESRLTVQGAARVRRTDRGRVVVYEPPPVSFPGSFRVSLVSPLEVQVGDGLVSGLVPRIDGERIDGIDDEGEPLDGGRPSLECDEPGPEGRSYVVLAASPGLRGEIDPEAEAPLSVEHLAELPPGLRDPETGRIYRIAAVLEWAGEGRAQRISRVRQVVWYDQEVYEVDGVARWRAAS